MRTFQTAHPKVEHIAFAAGGRLLLTAAQHDPLRPFSGTGVSVWDLADEPAGPVFELFPDHAIGALAVNPDGRWVYAGTMSLAPPHRPGYSAVDLKTREPFDLDFGARWEKHVAVSADGRRLAAPGINNQTTTYGVRCWDQPADGPPAPAWWGPSRNRSGETAVAFSPDGAVVATFEASRVHRGHPGWVSEVRIVRRSANTGTGKGRVVFPNGTAKCLAFSPAGQLVALSGSSLFVYGANGDAPVRVGTDGRRHLTAMAFHPAGRYLAATSNDATVRLYDVETWQVTKTYTWKVGALRSVAFSPDGLLAAVGSDTGQVVVWDVDL